MGKQAGHDQVVVPGDDAGDVLGRFALAQLDGVRAKVDCVAAQAEEALEWGGERGWREGEWF